MTITCPTCKAILNLAEDRLPKNRAFSAPCPQCKGKIVIDPTVPDSAPAAVAGAAPAPVPAAASPLTPPPSEAPISYEEQGHPLALVCVDDPAERDRILAVLKAQGYAPHAPTSSADAIQRLRFTAYALLVLREGYGRAGGEGSPVLDFVAEMGMASRRLMHVLLVSSGVRSHDTAAAFAKSVNLVIHANDLPHLPEALARSRKETEQAQQLLLESLRAAGKG